MVDSAHLYKVSIGHRKWWKGSSVEYCLAAAPGVCRDLASVMHVISNEKKSLRFERMYARHTHSSSSLERDEAEPNVDHRPIAFQILQVYPARPFDILVRFFIFKAHQQCRSSK